MGASRHPKRSQQLATSGVGVAFTTPIKRRSEKKKSNIRVVPLAQAAKRQVLEARLAKLMERSNQCKPPILEPEPVDDQPISETHYEDQPEPDGVQLDAPQTPIKSTPKTRRTLPDASANNLYRHWQELLPHLVRPYLKYIETTTAKELQPIASVIARCEMPTICEGKTHKILCLFADRKFLSHI